MKVDLWVGQSRHWADGFGVRVEVAAITITASEQAVVVAPGWSVIE